MKKKSIKETRLNRKLKDEQVKTKPKKHFFRYIVIALLLFIIFFIYQTLKLEKLITNIMNIEDSVVYDIERKYYCSIRYRKKTRKDFN